MNQAFSSCVNVVIQHRVPVIAEGLAAALGRHADVRIAAASFIGEEAMDAARGGADVAVTDYATGLSLLQDGTSPAGRRLRVLIVASSDRESEVTAALRAGAHGYVLLDCGMHELISGVLALGRGGRYLGSAVANRLADSMAHETLTERETDVLLLMVRGLSNKLIARDLGIALGTVKAHARTLFGKLQVSTRLQAVVAAGRRGLVQAPPGGPHPH